MQCYVEQDGCIVRLESEYGLVRPVLICSNSIRGSALVTHASLKGAMQDLTPLQAVYTTIIISRVFLGGGSVNFKCVLTSGANCGEGGNSLKGKIL